MTYHIMEEKQAVRQLQTYLLEISYAQAAVPHISVDGIYGSETEEAVRAFQLQNGLSPSGEADTETWDAIYESYLTAYEERMASVTLLPQESLPLSFRDRGSEVAILQLILRELTPNRPAETGRFDSETAAALRTYQRRRGLPASGILDRKTWEFLVQDYGARAGHAN